MSHCIENENEILKDTWSSFGKDEPYWSVITNDQYKASVINDVSIQQFYESGTQNIEFIENVLKKHNVSFADKTVLDFGCGLGRLSLALAPKCRMLYGVDISHSHLELAEKHTKGTSNVSYKLITCPKDIKELKNYGVERIVTLIVLQHNRPTLMKEYITELLDVMVSQGVAAMHIPYYIPNYWATPTPGLMEMHYLPKEDVYELVKGCGCEVLEVNEDKDMCGGGIKNALYVIRKL